MTTITIRVRDSESVNLMLRLLESLEFVDSIETSLPEQAESREDFLGIAGIWADRNISIESIREQAWNRQSQ